MIDACYETDTCWYKKEYKTQMPKCTLCLNTCIWYQISEQERERVEQERRKASKRGEKVSQGCISYNLFVSEIHYILIKTGERGEEKERQDL